jgi:mono/diheme cytochrome c family protein
VKLPGAAALLVAAGVLLPAPAAFPQGMGGGGGSGDDAGRRVFKQANCVGCHHWTGTGGGGYGGAAGNLRTTQLTREQLVETIRCGRPATGMPYFERDAYTDGRCYGLKKADLADGQMPPAPDRFLRASEVEVVADYVIANLQGRGEPTFAECQAFFGTQTRACNTLKP